MEEYFSIRTGHPGWVWQEGQNRAAVNEGTDSGGTRRETTFNNPFQPHMKGVEGFGVDFVSCLFLCIYCIHPRELGRSSSLVKRNWNFYQSPWLAHSSELHAFVDKLVNHDIKIIHNREAGTVPNTEVMLKQLWTYSTPTPPGMLSIRLAQVGSEVTVKVWLLNYANEENVSPQVTILTWLCTLWTSPQYNPLLWVILLKVHRECLQIQHPRMGLI